MHQPKLKTLIHGLEPSNQPVSNRLWAPCQSRGNDDFAASATPLPVQAHRKGIYASEAEAFRQADKIGCTEVHENNGRWMPCADERELHQQMRRQ